MGLGAGLAVSAWAGGWIVSYSGGTATEWTSGTQPYAVSNGVYGGGGSAASGQITATFTWDYFQDGSDEPPDSVYVLETCSAGGMSDNMHSAPTGDNGLASGTVFSSTSPAPGYIQTTANSSGTQLTCYIIGGAHSFSVTASPSASGFQGSSVQYTAAVVQKAVTIDASNDESFHKGPDGTPVSNLTEVATPKYGDIGIDPNAAIYNFGAWWYPVTISFSTELLRTWNRPVHSWDVDGTTYTDDFFSTYTSVPGAWTLDAATVASMGSGGSLDKIVTLTVNEAQQQSVSASALFHMRIHNLYDDWQNFGSPWPIYEEVQNFQIDNPGYAQAGGGIQCT